MDQDNKSFLQKIIPVGIVFIVLGGFLIYTFMQLSALTEDVGTLTVRVESIATDLASTTATLLLNSNQLSQNITDLRSETVGLSNTLSGAQQNIDAVKTQVGGVEQAVGSISGTVDTLQKLAQIDPELLKKYSKSYFLNENYSPTRLINIPDDYAYSTLRTEQFLIEAWPFLKDLIDTAKANGVILYVKSGFRSFTEQQSIKSLFSVIYGADSANSFSADQGYSEHQLGTTLDFITTGLSGQVEGFENTQPYQWLLDNAYRFGFELSYPADNGFYVFEPWHWRFVGVKFATYLHNENLNFYDLEQREIDTYLINIFD